MARKGILGTKLGMTQVFDENNRVVPVTVVKAGPNVVTRIRTPESDGYSAVQLAYGEISPRKINKPLTIVSEGKGAFVIAPQRADASEMFFGKQKKVDEKDRAGWDKFMADKQELIKFLQEDAEAFGEAAVTASANIIPNSAT